MNGELAEWVPVEHSGTSWAPKKRRPAFARYSVVFVHMCGYGKGTKLVRWRCHHGPVIWSNPMDETENNLYIYRFYR